MKNLLKAINNQKYIVLGLLAFYVTQVLSPNKIIYFSSYFVAVCFFFLQTKKISKSIIFSLILAFFSELGTTGNFFIFGIFIITLIPFSLIHNSKQYYGADIFAFLFFIWNFIVTIYYPYDDSLIGLSILSQITVIYFLLRIHLSKEDLFPITSIIISMILFQNILGISQFIMGRNIGLLTEASTVTYPFGLTALEDDNLFRITAAYAHANIYAIILVTLLPFLFFNSGWIIYFIRIFWLFNLVFTQARIAWLIGFILFAYLTFIEFLKQNKKTFKKFIFKNIGFLVILLFLFPFIVLRLTTINQALEENGSFKYRIKLVQESLNIISQTPFVGIGINRFQEVASDNPITDIFPVKEFSTLTNIHNVFMEIAVAGGLPSLLLFLCFLTSIYFNYFNSFKKSSKHIKYLIVFSLSALIFISSFHPVFLVNQFRLFYLFAALLLV